MMAIIQYLLAEKTVTWRRQITVGGVVAAMVFMAGALAAGTGVGLSGWVFAMVMGFSMAMYDTLVELAGRYGYKPVALFSRATMRANALALLAALALGWEDPAEAAALDGYQWTAMALTALATAGFSVLGPWISFEISPSMTDATEQLSVTLGFLVDVLAFGSDFTALEAVGAALVLVMVMVFYALEAVEQSDEHKAHEQLFERWRDPTGTWPYATRFGAAALVLAVVLGAGYVPALLGAGPTQTRFAARRRCPRCC